MKMAVQFFFLAMAVSANASAAVHNKDVWRARNKGAEFDVVFRIVDDEGSPVVGARCGGWIYMEREKDHGRGYAEYADTNGYVRIAGKSSEWFSVVIRKEGYYRTMFDVKYPAQDANPPIVDGKWQPYGETRTVVLKRIKNPIEMVETPYRINKAVSFGKWYGYDIIRSDWTPPHGKGEHLDVLVRLGLTAVNDTSDFRTTMELCFTNNPYSGVYKVGKDNWSEMKSAYNADTNAVYQDEISFEFERHPHKPIVDTRLSEDSYLVFRIRTQVDASGNLVSAHYGKIYGLWAFFGAMTAPELFFNPTPNDTNIEDAETARKSRLGYKQQLEFERRRKTGGK